MAQHFLLSAAARTLSLKTIYAEGEEAAYRRFCVLRWPETDGAPICPRCNGRGAYVLAAQRRFKCKTCHHQFSVTSGTIFASRKLAFVDLLGAIAVLVNGAKGVSALQLSRCAGLSYKTAFVLAHKIREALASATEKGLDNLEDDGIAQRRVRRIEITGAHHSLGEGASRQLGTILKLQRAKVRNLSLPEEAVAHDVACALLLDVGE